MWIMEIQIENVAGELEWHAVHPTGGDAYRYDTREEAENMLRICYGPPCLDANRQRVREE